ncbi:NAD(P)H-dependent glycerol-3-phosphate dehydrogenase [[Mycoplasma] mobile]|uniref:Glycerol-3-phosphate dehydrogenase [NAD(P)+] n=1 Tax=Mycoplasma mobile (strain ATCC 43663 / 163K / NCTC 11711) TaxID=267748 RepID=GPDA_MYCM1|nr:NAD(P)H-dependent glycerol-3-phosphate dehydrogenase [[Mycoplasma] mobile]Q6KHG2.2 RecName: Full=Glycerol-3-phosphate dehydrogenase [NAD(P)+]; AltName: Full=NAD(P)H-dependent glycerol-3-phosphate dehydrogenase [Mycoplasma mobile 163K]
MNKTNKISIIGSGAMATAMAKVLYDSGNTNIFIYGIDEKELEDLKIGKNAKYFSTDIKLPSFNTTKDLKIALDKTDYIVLAIPSIFIQATFLEILKLLNSKVLVISVSKGFYPNSFLSIHEGLSKDSKSNEFVRGVVTVTGPSFAEEIIKEQLTTICAVDSNIKNAQEVQKLFSNKYFKLYVQSDVIGAEVGASFKNVLAIFSGIANQQGYGINTLASILSRGLKEMKLYNDKVGGKLSTLLGLTGVGDLILTATSPLSRNFSFGKEFVINKSKALETVKTVEGLKALENIYRSNKKYGLDLPIISSLYELIFENISLEEFKEKIWNRTLKSEFE